MLKDLPVDVGLIYEGERIRKSNMHADFAGPKSKGAELLRIGSMGKVRDGDVKVIGPDIKDIKEGDEYPLGIFVEVAGKKLEEDLEGVFERRIHDFANYIQGFMHLNSRDVIWCRVSKESAKKGLSFKHIGMALMHLFKSEFDVIEAMQITFYTDKNEVDEFLVRAREVYEMRDSRVRGLKDEDVDVFYGCVLCQSFAPKHVCTITPSRTSACGSITWFEGRAAVKVDPKGPIFEVPKGKELDQDRGEYSGVNETTNKRSSGEVDRVFLHSLFQHPHTSCGCFEAIGFYIPEVDGVGIVHRDFHGVTPFGIPFSTMAGQVGGGVQSEGFMGMAIEYMRSPKFLKADGGWERTVWMPKAVKERIGKDVPEHLRDRIATEEDAADLVALKAFLKAKQHPVVKKWVEEKVSPPEASSEPAAIVPELEIPIQGNPVLGGGISITFKNAKIYAEKIIITRKQK